jgi:hypothetical protein
MMKSSPLNLLNNMSPSTCISRACYCEIHKSEAHRVLNRISSRFHLERSVKNHRRLFKAANTISTSHQTNFINPDVLLTDRSALWCVYSSRASRHVSCCACQLYRPVSVYRFRFNDDAKKRFFFAVWSDIFYSKHACRQAGMQACTGAPLQTIWK